MVAVAPGPLLTDSQPTGSGPGTFPTHFLPLFLIGAYQNSKLCICICICGLAAQSANPLIQQKIVNCAIEWPRFTLGSDGFNSSHAHSTHSAPTSTGTLRLSCVSTPTQVSDLPDLVPAISRCRLHAYPLPSRALHLRQSIRLRRLASLTSLQMNSAC